MKIRKRLKNKIAAGTFILLSAAGVIRTNGYSAFATESTQLLILSETAKQTTQQLLQLETAIKQKEAQLMELISLPERTFNQFKSQYDKIVGDYKNLINKYKGSARNIRNMTERMRNYDYNPQNLLRTLDDGMTMLNGVVQNNVKALEDYQRILEKEARTLSPEQQRQEIKSITNTQTGLQRAVQRLVSIERGLARFTQIIVNNRLEDIAIQQSQEIIRKQQRQQVAREQAGFNGMAQGFDEASSKTKAKTRTTPSKTKSKSGSIKK